MNLHQLFLTNNTCYKAGVKIKPRGLMLHSTGANNPNLRRYVGPDDGLLGVNRGGNHWNTAYPSGIAVCVHGFIGKLADGSIATYQTLPWDMLAWHAAGSANSTHIGVEICEDNLTDKAYFNAVYKEAVELFAYLCKMFNLTEKDIICHSEGYRKGIASNHGDVMHWFPKHGKSMDTFRADVKKLLTTNQEDEEMIEQLKKEIQYLNQTVKMLEDELNKLAHPMIYNYIDDNMPSWARPSITKLVTKGILKGNEKGELGLTDEMLRIYVTNDRAGIYDKE